MQSLIKTLRRIETVLGSEYGYRTDSAASAASSGGTVRDRSNSDQDWGNTRTDKEIEDSLSPTNRLFIRTILQGLESAVRENLAEWHGRLQQLSFDRDSDPDNMHYIESIVTNVHSMYDIECAERMWPNAEIAATLLGFMRGINPTARTYAQILAARSP